MARRPVEIEKARCGYLWGAVKQRCLCLDVAGRCTASARGIVLLSGDARTVAQDVLAAELAAMLSLYGAVRADDAEQSALDYLNLIAKR
jgi:hypothetical protein